MSEELPLTDVVTSDDRRELYTRRGLWDDATLAGQVAARAHQDPAATAVIDSSGMHTVGDLASAAAGLAASWRDLDVRAGDVVSIQLPNWYEAVVVAVAAQSVGAVINPLLPNYRYRELRHVFTTARPSIVVTPDRYREFDHGELVRQVIQDTGVRPTHIVVRPIAPAGGVPFDSLLGSGSALDAGTAAAVSELIFTSGTEAVPKAIMHTEQTANFSVRVAFTDLALESSDVVWMPSPIGHSTGFNYGVRFALYHGLPLVLQDPWSAETALGLIETHSCSYTLAATTFLQDLVDTAQRADVRLASLQRFGCGGSPVPAALVDAALERGIEVLRLYGSTEALVATWNRPGSDRTKRRLTDGRAMTDVDVMVKDDEIYVRGPNTCVGFFRDEERTAATFDTEGWVKSGDVGQLDQDGYLTVVGRKKEIIIRGGLNIAPREIEDLLCNFPEVERAAVIGLPDRRLGERMCACVVLRAGETDLTLEEAVARLRGLGLASFKLPERLVIVHQLPTTASGKTQKHELVRSLLEEGALVDGP